MMDAWDTWEEDWKRREDSYKKGVGGWKGVKFEWTHGTSYLKAPFGRILGQEEYFVM